MPPAQRLGITERSRATSDPRPNVIGVNSSTAAAEDQPPVLATTSGPREDKRPLGGREATSRITPPSAPAAPPEQRTNDDNGAQQAHDREGPCHGIGNYVQTEIRTVLDRAVAIATNGAVEQARPAQLELAEAIAKMFASRGRLAAEAPTGSGKTLAVMVPAALAASRGERTAVSTETLGLQSQIVYKDGPAAIRAVEETTGYRATLAPLKGWSNYACFLAARATAVKATGILKRLVDWALAEAATDGTGDRADCPIDIDDEMWDKVSIGPTACPGQEHCPFGSTCRPAAARQSAAESDIVVVNHSILAMQVVTAAPVIIGSEQLGKIDHLVIDEAHSFAAKVRSHGTVRISSRLLAAAARSLEACHGHRHSGAMQGIELAKALDAQLSTAAQRFGADKALGKEVDIFSGLATTIEAWAARERRGLQVSHGGLLTVASAKGRLDDLSDSLRRANKDGTASWLEPGDSYELSTGVKLSGTRLVVAPVETAGAIAGNLFGSKDDPARPSVVALSATLPASALPEVGIGVKRTVYSSPFEDAYRESLLYVPKLGASSPTPLDRRGRLAVMAHQDWVEPLILRLVEANGGSALVLAATTSAGRRYAKALQQVARGRWAVHSQWEGSQARVVQAWRADVGSVLVGTRSLMTGVDAPGATCTLVVVDRVPRAAPNPVDDARRDALVAKLSIDRWAADRYVYVADATLLLSQAAGRLVRSSSDRGLVAVLDPRLLKGPSAYPEPTRKALLGALGRFVTKTTDLREALAFAQTNRERRDAKLTEVG